MTIKLVKNIGIVVHISKDITVLFNKKLHKVTVFKKKEIVNDFNVEPTYKASEFVDFIETVTNQLNIKK